MPSPKRIAICGDSLLLAAVADSLAAYPGFQTTCIPARLPEALTPGGTPAWLAGCDVALVENGAGCENDRFTLALLQAQPNLPVISLDAGRSVLTVLSGRQQTAASVADLVSLIEELARPALDAASPL